MHIYVYDNYVGNKKYVNLLAQIETRITDLGLNGKIIRLEILKNIFPILDEELKKGAITITAVGNNHILNEIINAYFRSESINEFNFGAPIGFIPIGKENNSLAKLLGIPFDIEACDVLSARRTEKIDIIQANDSYFLGEAEIESEKTVLKIDNEYSIEINNSGNIKIINLGEHNVLPSSLKSNPFDGKMEIAIITEESKGLLSFKKAKKNHSYFSVKNLTVLNKNKTLVLDKIVSLKTPVNLRVLKKRLAFIVGKNGAVAEYAFATKHDVSKNNLKN